MCVANFEKINEPIPDEGERWGNEKNGLFPQEEACHFIPDGPTAPNVK